jgi:hypothetical protein
MLEFDEILESVHFWILVGVGYGAFFLMLIVLKSMNQKEIMPLWVKIVTMIVIPIASWAFAKYAEG